MEVPLKIPIPHLHKTSSFTNMEVPVINRIGEFDGGVSCAQHDPSSFLSRVFSIPEIEKIPQAYSFWKWGALLLAFAATFSGIFNTINFFLIRFRSHGYPVSKPHILGHSEDEVRTDDDETSSSYSSDDDEGEGDAGSPVEVEPDDFRVADGCSDQFEEKQLQNSNVKLWQCRSSIGDRFSWSEFASGKSVVKLWDGLGLGLDLNNSSGSVLSIYDLNKEQKISSIFGATCQIPALSASSPAVILSAGVESSRNLALKAWDLRVGCHIPAILAEWGLVRGKVVRINSSGVEKVYVRDDASGDFTVGVTRNVKSPLENVMESDGNTWWDADAVMVSNVCRRRIGGICSRIGRVTLS